MITRHLHRTLRIGPLFAGLFMVAANPAQASRTGLNNIPIAAVSEPGTGVVQMYSAFGEGRKPSMLTGARVGFQAAGERMEAGFDSRWKPGTAVPLFFNAKWASKWNRHRPALGIGIAGAALRSEDRRSIGQPQSYLVLSQTLKIARLHAGHTFQSNNGSTFFGLDRSWRIAGRSFTLRTDMLQIQARSQWLGSIGFTYKLGEALGMELWNSIPTSRGKAYLTLKLGYSFRY